MCEKKKIPYGIICILIMMLVAGCSYKKPEDNTEKNYEDNEIVVNPEDIWDVDENTIIWVSFDDIAGNKTVEERVNKKLEEDGYPFRLKYISLGMSGYNEKITECGGDIVFDGAGMDGYIARVSPAYDAIIDGKFLELDDYLKDSRLYDFFPEMMWDSIRVNGNIYTIPNTNFEDSNLAVVFDKDKYTEDEISTFDGTLDSLWPLVSEERKLYYYGGGWAGYLDLYGISNYDQYGIYFEENRIKNLMSLDIVINVIKKMHEMAVNNMLIDGSEVAYTNCEGSWAIALIDASADTGLDEERYVIKRYKGDMYPRFNGAIAILKSSHNPEYAFKMMELFITDRNYGNLIIYGDDYEDVNGYAVNKKTGSIPYSWNVRLTWGINDGVLKGIDTAMFDSPDNRKKYYDKYLRPANTSFIEYYGLIKELSELYRKHKKIITNFENFDEELTDWIHESEEAFRRYKLS